MDVWDILREIWNLPWYKIIVVAIADDAIALIRIGLPLLVIVILIAISAVAADKMMGRNR